MSENSSEYNYWNISVRFTLQTCNTSYSCSHCDRWQKQVTCLSPAQTEKYKTDFSQICLKIATSSNSFLRRDNADIKFYIEFFKILFFDYLTLKMEALRTSETCVPTYQTVSRNISEDLNFTNTNGKTSNLTRNFHFKKKAETSFTR
jgi:hypothetical protein